jgi:hypothetical protein
VTARRPLTYDRPGSLCRRHRGDCRDHDHSPRKHARSHGRDFADWGVNHNGAAGNKTFEVLYSTTAGTNYGFVGSTQGSGTVARTVIRNKTTGTQSGGTMINYNGGSIASGIKFGASDTTASTTIVFRLTNATATNWMGVVGGSFFTEQ